MNYPRHQQVAERLGLGRNYYWPQGYSHFGASFERLPRFWLYYAVDLEGCAFYRTPEACVWTPVGAWAHDEAQAVAAMDAQVAAMGAGAPVTFIRGLYDPHSGQWAAWSALRPASQLARGTNSTVQPAPWGESIEI